MSSQHSKNHRQHELMPLGASRKRKDRDVLDAYRAPVTTKPEPAAPLLAARRQQAQQQQQQQQPQPAGSGNRLLAGYLAHEFLTKGTLLGRRWDPSAAARAKPLAPASHGHEPKEPQPQQKEKQPAPAEPKRENPPTGYAEVGYLLKTDGVHIPGVVNPTQLARWLRM